MAVGVPLHSTPALADTAAEAVNVFLKQALKGKKKEDDEEERRKAVERKQLLAVPCGLRTLVQISRLEEILAEVTASAFSWRWRKKRRKMELPRCALPRYARHVRGDPSVSALAVRTRKSGYFSPIHSSGTPCLVLQWIQVHSSVWRLGDFFEVFYAKVDLGSEVDSQLPEDCCLDSLGDDIMKKVGVFCTICLIVDTRSCVSLRSASRI